VMSCATDMMAQMTGPPKSGYEVIYWPVSALGEPIRLTMVLGGLEFTDTTPKTDEKFMEKKLTGPYGDQGQVPILKLPDGSSMCQSRAILRYLGSICTYNGVTMNPTSDPLVAYKINELIETCEDIRSPIGKTFAIKDQAEKEAARKALFSEGGPSAKWLKVLDAELGKLPMQTPNIANIYAFCIINMFRAPTFLDGLNDMDIITGLDNIKKHQNWIANLPEVKKYYAGRDDRKAFQPIP